jgi:cysteinyl-tRNA synthetase
MWLPAFLKDRTVNAAPLYLFNTLSKEKDEFRLPKYAKAVRMYNCGPTVYGIQHIGNLSMFVFTDILRRTLEFNTLKVTQVINFTDFGHLTSDADEGDDKMLKGLKREGLAPTLENMREMGKKYAEIFKDDLRKLNIDVSAITFPFASDYIPAQIAMIQTLEEKGYAYRGERGVYFDTSRFSDYGKLGSIDLKGLREGARVEADTEKRNPTDFILWKSSGRLGWDSPWGTGFPGWHIECSAMINSILGKQIDIHTGGIEHIPVHHNNEIAQSESATGKRPLSRFWMHRAHLQIDDAKIAKSDGNTIYLSDIIEKGFHPLALRYLFLTAHYRTSANFTWSALEAAQTSFLKLRRISDSEERNGTAPPAWRKKILERFNDDLDTPGAIALIWEMLKDTEVARTDAKALILDADRILGLGLAEPDPLADSLCKKIFGVPIQIEDLPERVRKLTDARENARKEKNWQQADNLRNDLQKLGYTLEDTAGGSRVFKKD